MSDIKHIYNTFQNKDEDLFRSIIIGTLHSFRDKIYWYNTINSEKNKVDVPFYFTIAGSERFLMDIFLNQYKLDNGEQSSESVYLKYPRAHINLDSFSIEEEYLTNKFTRANYLKQSKDGELNMYNAEFQNIPMKLNMNVTIFVDSIIDIFKCIKSIMEMMYKNVYYYVDVFNINIPCHFFIPDSINNERNIQFGYSDKKELKITFDIEVRADYPLFKQETEMFAGNTMNSIIYKIIHNDNYSNNSSTGRTVKVERDVWPSGNNQTNFYSNEETE